MGRTPASKPAAYVTLISVKLQFTVARENTELRPQGSEAALYRGQREKRATGHRRQVAKDAAYLDAIDNPEELRALTAWKAHTLKGDRKGTWSMSVTRNRRLTFRIDFAEGEIWDVNLEDYH